MRIPRQELKSVRKSILSALLCCVFLGGCAGTYNPMETAVETREEAGEETIESSPETVADEKWEVTLEKKEESYGAVSYFDEDANGLLQHTDGYLYGYLEGRIFRVDAQTGETTVLVAMKNTMSNHFCIDNGYLYYFYIPQISFLDGVRGDLYRLDLNSADSEAPVLLAENVRITEENRTGYEKIVKMSVYEDVLYIMLDERAVCFKLLVNGTVEEVAMEDTLYGLLPEGYSAIGRYGYNLPSIPDCAAHYGYFFAQNEKNILIRVDVGSGKWESLGGKTAYREAFLTHEGIYLADRENSQWIRYGLDDMTGVASSPWFSYDYMQDMIDWDENGVYFIEMDNGETAVTRLLFVDWEGNEELLISFEKQIPYPSPYGMEGFYLRDGWLYYRDQYEDGRWLLRISLAGGESEKLYCYDLGSRLDAVIRETEIVEKNTENTGERRMSTSITKLWIKEEQTGDAAINAALKKIYAEAEAELEEENREIMDHYLYDYEADEALIEEMLAMSYEYYTAYIDYADEDYLGICMMGEGYWGGAHGGYWYDYYVFDRHTGKRLTLQDFVNNSPEEIVEIVRAYIVAGYEWTDGSPAEDALEVDRFFLTTEGLGIHYDVYEIGSYVDGPFEFIIPFEVFDMKEGRT